MLLFEGIAAVVAKVASASSIAQATAGLGIAVAGVTGAGAAGILPGPVQDGVASTVEAVTPFDLPHSVDDRISGIDDGHQTRSGDDSGSPSTVPTTAVSPPSVAAPTTAHEEHGTEIEDHGSDGVEDGTHQHRGGRTAAATPTTSGSDSDDSAGPTPEVEDHHGGGDSGHGDGDDSGDDSGSDDHSGHGGGDDD